MFLRHSLNKLHGSDRFFAYHNQYKPYSVTDGENENSFSLNLAVIGFKKEDISIELSNKTLIIEANKKEESNSDSEKSCELYKGLASKTFYRSFAIEENIKVISASLEDGILSIKLEKHITEKEKPLKIEVL